jgi:hypothetical protein
LQLVGVEAEGEDHGEDTTSFTGGSEEEDGDVLGA